MKEKFNDEFIRPSNGKLEPRFHRLRATSYDERDFKHILKKNEGQKKTALDYIKMLFSLIRNSSTKV